MPLLGKVILAKLAYHALHPGVRFMRRLSATPVKSRLPGGAAPAKEEPGRPPISVPEFDNLSVDERLRLGEQGLFIIGSARSGTTILQDALNDSRDVYLFGEPDFHTDPGTADFAFRYNRQHRLRLNQETKSSFCPAFFAGDAPWSTYFLHLSRLHRYVGSKIVLNPGSEDHMADLFDFHMRYFYRSRYVFTFRNPLDSIVSIRQLSSYLVETNPQIAEGEGVEYGRALTVYVHIIRYFIRMLRTFPFVDVVFMEDDPADTFDRLRRHLGIDLSGSAGYYAQEKVGHYRPDGLSEKIREIVERLDELYETLRREAATGFRSLQMSQNDANLSSNHLLPIGRMHRATDLIVADLANLRSQER